MNKFFYLLVVCILTICASCQRLPDVQGKGLRSIQGVWNEDHIDHADQLLTYTQQKFKFSCDSFYVDLVTHSKVNYYEDSCFNKGVWKEYAKGVYQVKGDTILLEGTYTKSNYKQKTSGCYQIGRYLKTFYVSAAKKDTLVLENVTDQRKSVLALKEAFNCVPKSL
jgi:hypothetical protein